MVLFEQERNQFFRPLTSKYRAVIVECLGLLYRRLYGIHADYGQSLSREQVLDVFVEALARAPVLETDAESALDQNVRFKNEREQANWILNLLLEYGWLAKQVDQATLQSSFPFTRAGRLFTQALVDVGATRVRTRHRNTRNTLNALEAFSSRGQVHDLLDAYEYSERIIADFTDVIAELEERKRELVQQIEASLLIEQATEQFFDFMEKRFQPDVSVRLSADSVEKHRDALHQVINRIRRKRKEFKRDAELALRELAPELVHGKESVLYFLLDTIESRMTNAADLMLPALRRALQGFTKRADIIIRQLSYLHSQKHSDVVAVCRQLNTLSEQQQSQRLQSAGQQLAGCRLQFVDPGQVKLQQRRKPLVVNTRVAEQAPLHKEERRQLLVQNAMDQAFVVQNDSLKSYLLDALGSSKSVHTGELAINSAHDLLAMAHAVEAVAQLNLQGEEHLEIEYVGQSADHPYFRQYDVFKIKRTEGE